MKHLAKGVFCAGFFSLGLVSTADATLIGRLPATPGGTDYQAYYDSTLDITWLADANLAASNTFGLPYNTNLGMHPNDNYTGTYNNIILPYGLMAWGAALHWIDAMNSANYLGFNDWRLPTVLDTGSPGCNYSSNGTDCGYNAQTGSASTTVYSELASLWYDTLGNLAYTDTAGNAPQPGWGMKNKGPFSNFQYGPYWLGVEYALTPNGAWLFDSYEGYQGFTKKEYSLFGWAVRSGDVVSTVPEPGMLWLFGSSLLGLMGIRRRKR
jgi:hypothetical protein